jgi:hypothetical protein
MARLAEGIFSAVFRIGRLSVGTVH